MDDMVDEDSVGGAIVLGASLQVLACSSELGDESPTELRSQAVCRARIGRQTKFGFARGAHLLRREVLEARRVHCPVGVRPRDVGRAHDDELRERLPVGDRRRELQRQLARVPRTESRCVGRVGHVCARLHISRRREARPVPTHQRSDAEGIAVTRLQPSERVRLQRALVDHYVGRRLPNAVRGRGSGDRVGSPAHRDLSRLHVPADRLRRRGECGHHEAGALPAEAQGVGRAHGDRIDGTGRERGGGTDGVDGELAAGHRPRGARRRRLGTVGAHVLDVIDARVRRTEAAAGARAHLIDVLRDGEPVARRRAPGDAQLVVEQLHESHSGRSRTAGGRCALGGHPCRQVAVVADIVVIPCPEAKTVCGVVLVRAIRALGHFQAAITLPVTAALAINLPAAVGIVRRHRLFPDGHAEPLASPAVQPALQPNSSKPWQLLLALHRAAHDASVCEPWLPLRRMSV
eukprot:4856030-Prymnesium_polylepis.4